MRYFKYLPLLLLLLLCSCSNDKNNKSDSQPVTEQVTSETISATETTAEIETTQATAEQPVTETTAATSAVIPVEDKESDAPKAFPVLDGADGQELKNHYSFKVQSDGVWVYYDDITAQFLDADCCWYDSSSDYNENKLNYWHDYDFDGYFDLFIPEDENVYSGTGHYFHFNTETGLFVIWDEMNKLGIQANTNNYPDNIVYTNSSDEDDNTEQKIYIWDNEQLVLKEREYNYKTEITEDGYYRICDNYTYENGYEELYRRRRLFYSNGSEWPSIDEDVPIE